MYPQSQQQGGYPYPQQGGYPYPQPNQQPYSGYGAPPPGPGVNLSMGQPAGQSMFGGGGEGGWGAATDGTGLFAEKAIRKAFVSKVFSIVGLQLLFSTLVIALVVSDDDTKKYFRTQGFGWLILAMIVMVVTMLILACVESARRSTPINFILLSVLTAAYSLFAAIAASRYSTAVILGAFAATAGSVLLLALFAKTTSFDMTGCGTTLCLLGLAHMIIGTIVILVVPGPKTHLIMAIVGALLVSLYLVFDLQLIMGGRKCEISPEEYIMASVMLYTDIITLFIYMLQIINSVSDD